MTDFANETGRFTRLSKHQKVSAITSLADIDRRELGNRTDSQLLQLYAKLIAPRYDEQGRRK